MIRKFGYQGALAGARFRYHFSFGERHRMLRLIRGTLGKSMDEGEIRRIAHSAYLYRAMDEQDSLEGEDLLFADEPRLPGKALVVTARSLAMTALRQWMTRHGFRPDAVVALPAPMTGGGELDANSREFLRENMHAKRPIVGIHLVRTGLTRFRFQPVVTLGKGGEASVEECLPSARQFLDDCLRENPAQYDWFAGHA